MKDLELHFPNTPGGSFIRLKQLKQISHWISLGVLEENIKSTFLLKTFIINALGFHNFKSYWK